MLYSKYHILLSSFHSIFIPFHSIKERKKSQSSLHNQPLNSSITLIASHRIGSHHITSYHIQTIISKPSYIHQLNKTIFFVFFHTCHHHHHHHHITKQKLALNNHSLTPSLTIFLFPFLSNQEKRKRERKRREEKKRVLSKEMLKLPLGLDFFLFFWAGVEELVS